MILFNNHRNSATSATVGIALGGIAWGLFWIPLRILGDGGLGGAMAGTALYLVAIAICLPWLWAVRHQLAGRFGLVVMCGLASGAGMGLFSTGIVLTEVVRAILLFYLTPVWATIAGLIFLGERLSPFRIFALVMGLGGAAILLGIGETLPLPKNLGDWLSFASGLTFAAGAMMIYRLKEITVTEQVVGFMSGAVVTSVVIMIIALSVGARELASFPTWPQLVDLIPHLLWGGLFVLLIVFLVIWPAKVLSPGRVSLLMMGEIIVGALTAAWFAGEHLNARELIGGILIVGAGLVEVFGNKTNTDQPPS